MNRIGSNSRRVLLLFTALLLLPACHRHRRTTIVVDVQGVVASDLQSIAAYLELIEVQDLLANGLHRYSGSSSAPNVSGTYSFSGSVTITTFPGSNAGDGATADFCFGTPSGAVLDVSIDDPTFLDAGAASFIEASGDFFTVYTAFKSLQDGPQGQTCELHQVAIFSGELLADGSITGLEIGTAIIGLVGDCASLLPGDLQISDGSTGIPAVSCFAGSPPIGPGEVLVAVMNDLLIDMKIRLSTDGFRTETTLVVKGTETGEVAALAGFELAFESLPPTAGGVEMGEILSGIFAPDTTPAGQVSSYVLTNDIGGDLFFAPLIQNHTDGPAFSVVNIGIANAPPDGSGGWDCLCSMPASLTDQYFVGYYSYDVPGLSWTPQEANVYLFNSDNPAIPPFVFDRFETPEFALEAESGAIGLLIEGSWGPGP
ncbi:MAG: hypothetical protein HY717_08720 [Planctomycetes bacterium]|nr:hypothetical protein [Planctomycetota bacterium]